MGTPTSPLLDWEQPGGPQLLRETLSIPQKSLILERLLGTCLCCVCFYLMSNGGVH